MTGQNIKIKGVQEKESFYSFVSFISWLDVDKSSKFVELLHIISPQLWAGRLRNVEGLATKNVEPKYLEFSWLFQQP